MRCLFPRVGAALILSGLLSLPAHGEDPKIAYWLHCAGCHLLDGTGAPPEVPTLIDEPGVLAGRPGGREYLIRIPGVAQAGLDDARLAAVLNYMLEAFSPETTPGDFDPYTAAEIARHRAAVLVDPLRTRAEIVGD